MCGIFGTTELERYKTLYKLNQDRGSFAFGGCYVSDTVAIQKTAGIVHPCSIVNDYEYSLGHTQGPTSAVREFDGETSHPFSVGDWVVAHNGVLSNDRELISKFGLEHKTSEVDSSVIPALLDYHEITLPGTDHEIEAITDTLLELSGTYSVWLVNKKSNNIYLARVGSTLFLSKDRREFSSRTTKGFKSIPEGVLLKYNKKRMIFEQVSVFEYDSPYLII
jgi:glucosamine 6-phosphate synthetase-like amidotransferase/phosphosugar isomerase protein